MRIMAPPPCNDPNDVSVLIQNLCSHITGLSGDAVTPYFNIATRLLSSHTSVTQDEIVITEKIKKHLVRGQREKDAASFSKLYQKLQGNPAVKQKPAVLSFLLGLKEENSKSRTKANIFSRGLNALAFTSFSFHRTHSPRRSNSETSENGTPVPYASSALSLRANAFPAVLQTHQQRNRLTASETESITDDSRRYNTLPHNVTDNRVARREPSRPFSLPNRFDNPNVLPEVAEPVLLKEIIFALQGIDGKIVTRDVAKKGYRIDSKAGISWPVRTTLLKLCELGWLYCRVNQFCNSSDNSHGLVVKCFTAALEQELVEYYRLIAVLNAQIDQDNRVTGEIAGITLKRLAIWTLDPLVKMKTLAALIDACKGTKGGALASVVYSYLQHGDPVHRSIVQHILGVVSVPIYTMLYRWIFEGELEDQFHEFFVASVLIPSDDNLWHEKYSLRKSMVPAFITTTQARKILSAGKSINFLFHVCQDRAPLPECEALKANLNMRDAEATFAAADSGLLQSMIDVAYRETSQRVLYIMHNKYNFVNHLKALRRYLLLGQGDFIRHLLDLLDPELAKPAVTLYRHHLSGILETAIRGTNAQFDDVEILQRLDVMLLEMCGGEIGWDVFSLEYHVHGPIGTVFTPNVMKMYLRLFNALWRAKRMQYVLSNMWQAQMTNRRMTKDIPALNVVFHQSYLMASEMIHFVQQMQYYIAFEVMECSWDVLEKKVREAEDLDQIIAAHEEFLQTTLVRAMLDEQSQQLLNQLRAIYGRILDFHVLQETLFTKISQELQKRSRFEEKSVDNAEKGTWGVTGKCDEKERQRRAVFIKETIPSTSRQLTILWDSYQSMVQTFLLMLTSHTDVSLQFLSYRLDFNDHYKRRDSRLNAPLTFQHRRLSSITVRNPTFAK